MAEDAKERTVPLVLIAIGFMLYVVAAFSKVGTAGAGIVAAFVAVSTLVGVALMLGGAYLTAAITGTSFGELRSALLKLAAIYLFPGALALWLPGGVAWLISIAVWFALLMWLFELEVVYAIVFTIVTGIIRFLALIIVAAAFASVIR